LNTSRVSTFFSYIDLYLLRDRTTRPRSNGAKPADGWFIPDPKPAPAPPFQEARGEPDFPNRRDPLASESEREAVPPLTKNVDSNTVGPTITEQRLRGRRRKRRQLEEEEARLQRGEQGQGGERRDRPLRRLEAAELHGTRQRSVVFSEGWLYIPGGVDLAQYGVGEYFMGFSGSKLPKLTHGSIL